MCKTIVCVTDFGAEAGKKEVQTRAFQKAIDHCFLAGGGEVTVPAGEYVIGDIRLRSNITLHLMKDAKLLGSRDPKDYCNIWSDPLEPLPEAQLTKARWYTPAQWKKLGGGFKVHLYTAGSYWNYGLIRAVYARNVAIIGEENSVIDGGNLYDPLGEEDYRGPHGINMHFCENIRFAGYTVVNAGNWAHAIFQSENVAFHNLTVLGGHDALHTRACDHVTISDCKLITGDDCIAGFHNQDVRICNCEISSACSAFRYGGRDILIENCRIYGPCQYQFRGSFSPEEQRAGAEVSRVGRNNMLCFFTNFVTDDLPAKKPDGNIVIRNCTVDGADRFFHLNLSGNEPWQRGDPPTSIAFENIQAQNIQTGLYAYGGGETAFDLTVKDFVYSCREGSEAEPFMKAAHFGRIRLENVKVSNYRGTAFIRTWSDDGTIEAENLQCDIADGQFRVRATEPFRCRPI